MAEVFLARWPEEHDDASRLAAAGHAVLYLVDADADPPLLFACNEDWVRLPTDDRDVAARLTFLRVRADLHAAAPSFDTNGDLRYHGYVISLAPEEVALARTLVARFGHTVPDDAFEVSDGTLRAQMTRLRTQLRTVGLAVRRIPRRGYVLC